MYKRSGMGPMVGANLLTLLSTEVRAYGHVWFGVHTFAYKTQMHIILRATLKPIHIVPPHNVAVSKLNQMEIYRPVRISQAKTLQMKTHKRVQ